MGRNTPGREETTFAKNYCAAHHRRTPEPGAHRCTKPACFAPACCIPDENFDGGRAFFSASRQGVCAYAPLRLMPNQAPEKKPVPFRNSGPHSLPRWKVSQRPSDCFPASRERFVGTLMSGPQDVTASLRSVCSGMPRHIVQARKLLAHAEPS